MGRRPQRGPPGRPLTDVVTTLRAAGCVFAEDEARLLIEAAGSTGDLAALVARRVAGEPLEHVIGWAEFCGLRVGVDPGVFVPRRRTAFLARQAAARVRSGSVVVDLCCGSGAVAAAIAHLAPGADLHAADIDPAAVRCARRNLTPGRVYEGDLFDPLPPGLRGRIDVLVANAPYVPSDAIDLMPPEARLHEPMVALDGGADGLDVLRRVIAAAPAWLAPGGSLLVETGERQAAALVADATAAGLNPAVVTGTDADATVVTASAPPA